MHPGAFITGALLIGAAYARELPAGVLLGPDLVDDPASPMRLPELAPVSGVDEHGQRISTVVVSEIRIVTKTMQPLYSGTTTETILDQAMFVTHTETVTKTAQSSQITAGPLTDAMKNFTDDSLHGLIDNLLDTIDLTDDAARRERRIRGYVNLRTLDYEQGCRTIKPGRGDLFFYHPEEQAKTPELEESNLFHVRTPWRLTYPRKLRKAFERKGFEMVEYTKACEQWIELWDVTRDGVKRGHIDWKYAIGSTSEQFHSYNDQWEMIEDALDFMYPGVEIAMVVLGSLTGAALLAFFWKWVWDKTCWGQRRRQRKAARRNLPAYQVEEDCVELRGTAAECCQCSKPKMSSGS